MRDAEKTKEESRDTRRVTWIQDLVQDLHYGLRMFRRSPGFTAVAVLTLALGIGANTAIFSIINAVLLQTLRVARPHELVLFSDSSEAGTNSGTQTGRWILFSSDNYKYFREHNESFKDLSAFQSTLNDLNIRFAGETGHADVAHGRLVSGNFFSLLGLSASLGRVFSESDDRSEASPTVMLSYTYWTRRFHNDPEILGKPIEINGTVYTIIGVAPPSFSDVKYDRPDIWFPLAFQSQVMSGNRYADDPQKYWLNLMGRLAAGMTLRQTQIVVNAQLQQILNTQASRNAAGDRELLHHPCLGSRRHFLGANYVSARPSHPGGNCGHRPINGLRECSQSAPFALVDSRTGNCRSARARGKSRAANPSTLDGEYSARRSGGIVRNPWGALGNRSSHCCCDGKQLCG